jgi:hypothetical protein
VEIDVSVLAYLISTEPIRDPGNLDACGVEVSSKLSSLSPLFHLSSFSGSYSFLSPLYEHVPLVSDLLFSTPARRFRSGGLSTRVGFSLSSVEAQLRCSCNSSRLEGLVL